MFKTLTLVSMLISFQALAEGAMGYSTSKTSTTSGLTDEEFIKSKEYVHSAYIQEKQDEACTGKEDECAGKELNKKILGVDSSMIKGIAKAYSTVMGTMGAMSKKKDYCAMIPIATETLASFQQTASQGTADVTANQSTAQKEALYKISRSYTARSDTAKIEFGGFAAAAACYPIQMYATKDYSWGTIAKFAASTALATFFYDEQKRYKEAASFTKDIADKLPGKGDCNPVTDKECFCAQESSKNTTDYMSACVPESQQRTYLASRGTPTSCIDASMKVDAKCRCASSNSCYSRTFASEIQGLSFANSLGTIFAPASEILGGTISDASLSASQGNLKNAIGKMREIEGKLTGSGDQALNAGDQKTFEKLGLTPTLAKTLASTNPGAGYDSAFKRISGSNSGGINLPSREAYYRSTGDSRVMEFGGSGPGRSGKKTTTVGFDMGKFGAKNQGKGNEQVLNYPSDNTVNKALMNADITNDSSRNLFEIVSRRYQLSAPSHLGN